MQQFTTNQEALQVRVDQLVELDESRRNDFDQMIINRDKIKGTFDQKTHQRPFTKGDLILMWDKRKENPGMNKKFDGFRLGP
jgi:hypothetical protein